MRAQLHKILFFEFSFKLGILEGSSFVVGGDVGSVRFGFIPFPMFRQFVYIRVFLTSNYGIIYTV